MVRLSLTEWGPRKDRLPAAFSYGIKKASRDSRKTPFFVFPFTVLNIRMD